MVLKVYNSNWGKMSTSLTMSPCIGSSVSCVQHRSRVLGSDRLIVDWKLVTVCKRWTLTRCSIGFPSFLINSWMIYDRK